MTSVLHIKTESLLPCSQDCVTDSYPEQDDFYLYSTIQLL